MKRLTYLCIALVTICGCSTDPSIEPQLATRDVITGLDTPWEILWGPDDWIWMTERPGTVSRVNPASGEKRVILTLTDVAESDQMEAGLLGLALHPNFTAKPLVYLVYTYYKGSAITERLVRYRYDGTALVDRTILLDDIPGFATHDGSRILFGPDGMLYMTIGDQQNQAAPQNTHHINGKILRLDENGATPADNPFASAGMPASLVWSKGHRNPQGLVFGPGGVLYSSEHGPSSDDEVNIIERGRNYGWPKVMGPCNTSAEQTYCADSNIAEPIASWSPTLAVAGLDYYSHTAISDWTNSLLLVNLRDASLHQLKLSSDGRTIVADNVLFANRFGRMRDLCIAPDGRVFLATSNRDGRGSPSGTDDRIVEIK